MKTALRSRVQMTLIMVMMKVRIHPLLAVCDSCNYIIIMKLWLLLLSYCATPWTKTWLHYAYMRI